jgi:paraquat-inducible protein B
MSDNDRKPPPDRRTEAIVEHSHWPGWIWAVPLAAAAIVIWLGLHYYMTHGVSVTVTFGKAPGVSEHGTKVTYLGVEVGEVADVSLAKDGRHVDVTLDLDHGVESYLRTGTRFWLQGAKPELSDLSSLKSVIAGPTIVMERGAGPPQRHFTGLEEAPAVSETTEGTHFTVTARKRGSVDKKSTVYYLGLEVGTVTSMQFTPPDQFSFDVFIRAPYDALVHQGSRFWDASAIDFSLAGGEFNTRLAAPAALLSGAVAFDTSRSAAALPRSRAGDTFTLYTDEASAERAPSGPSAKYTVVFSDAAGGLKTGAPVKLRGFTVGAVTDVEFHYDAATGMLSEPVTIELEADRLHITGLASSAQTDWTGVLNSALTRLIGKGLRARLQQDPPMVGSDFVSLDFASDAAVAALDFKHTPPAIPAASGGGLGAMTAKIGNLPIEQIGANVRDISAHLRTLVSSPDVQDSLAHLDRTLTEVDDIVHRAGPRVEPLIDSLRRTAGEIEVTATAAKQTMGGNTQQGGIDQAVRELTQAARSVRALADYLDRHPEALIEGKPQ